MRTTAWFTALCIILFLNTQIVWSQKGSPPNNKSLLWPTLKGINIQAAAFIDDATERQQVELVKEIRSQADIERLRGSVSFAMDVWLMLTEILNFTTRFVYLNKEDRGSATALRALVRSGRAEVVMSPTAIVSAHNLLLSHPVHFSRYRVYIRAPGVEIGGWRSLISVLQPPTWSAVVGAILLLALTLVTIEVLGRRAGLPGYLIIFSPRADVGQIVLVVLLLPSSILPVKMKLRSQGPAENLELLANKQTRPVKKGRATRQAAAAAAAARSPPPPQPPRTLPRPPSSGAPKKHRTAGRHLGLRAAVMHGLHGVLSVGRRIFPCIKWQASTLNGS